MLDAYVKVGLVQIQDPELGIVYPAMRVSGSVPMVMVQIGGYDVSMWAEMETMANQLRSSPRCVAYSMDAPRLEIILVFTPLP